MKKVITAIDNKEILNKIKNNKEFYIINKDIPYIEGIIEQLEKNKEINIIIIYEKIIKEESFKQFINQIKQINKKIEIIIIVDNIKRINSQINNIKGIKIIEKDNLKYKNKNQISNEREIITISGTENSGKNIVAIIIYNLYKKEKKLIDYNYKENQFLKVINKNYNLLSTIKIHEIFNKKNNLIIKIGNKTKEKEKILNKCKKNIIIVEPNLIGIKKAKIIIKNYTEKFKINKKDIYLIINKKNKYSICNKTIKNIFKNYRIITEIMYKEEIEKIINGEKYNLNNIISKREKNNIINFIN